MTGRREIVITYGFDEGFNERSLKEFRAAAARDVDAIIEKLRKGETIAFPPRAIGIHNPARPTYTWKNLTGHSLAGPIFKTLPARSSGRKPSYRARHRKNRRR